MKLSFSTRGWDGYSFEDYLAAAREIGFAGVELHGFTDPGWTRDGAPFSRANAQRTVRRMFDEGITLACLDSLCDLSCTDARDGEELLQSIQMAHDFSIPYVRVRALDASEAGMESARARVAECLPVAMQKGVTLLV